MEMNYRITYVDDEILDLVDTLDCSIALFESNGLLIFSILETLETYYVPNVTDEELKNILKHENALEFIRTWVPVPDEPDYLY